MVFWCVLLDHIDHYLMMRSVVLDARLLFTGGGMILTEFRS